MSASGEDAEPEDEELNDNLLLYLCVYELRVCCDVFTVYPGKKMEHEDRGWR